MARIYTKTGDDGTTGLIGGNRVGKDAPRIQAYGAVDELNAVLGVVRSHALPEDLDRLLYRIQDHLFTIGGELALPDGAERSDWGIPALTEDDTRELERAIDSTEQEMEPLQQFLLPGGSQPGALLHFARTVARRAERWCVGLSKAEEVDPRAIEYLNRLSDLCFVLARHLNQQHRVPEANPSFGK